MKIHLSIYLFILLLLGSGCSSPLVTTQMVKIYPQNTSPEEVKVFEPGDTLPQSVEVLGSISIRDRGNSIHCKYDEIIRLGQDKTAELGGNALGISLHIPPLSGAVPATR